MPRRNDSPPATPRPSDPAFEDRRAPGSARGLAVRLRRLKGLLKRPLGLERRGGGWHVVLVDRRRHPSPLAAPTEAEQLAELDARLLTVEHQHAASAMRQLLLVREKLRRKGWAAVEMLSAREIGRALVQCEMLASLEAAPAMTALVERLRLAKAAAEVRAERRAAALADDGVGQLEVTETSLDSFHDTQQGWVDTLSPSARGGSSAP